MSSLFDDIDEKTLAGADFVAEVTGEVRRAFQQRQVIDGITKKAVADRLSVSKTAVQRCLGGDANLTLRTLGELAWALDMKIDLSIRPLSSDADAEGDSPHATARKEHVGREVANPLPTSPRDG